MKNIGDLIVINSNEKSNEYMPRSYDAYLNDIGILLEIYSETFIPANKPMFLIYWIKNGVYDKMYSYRFKIYEQTI